MKYFLGTIFLFATLAMGPRPGSAATLSEAAAFMQSGQYGKAAAALETIVQQEPENVPALINLGVCLEALGRIGEAESSYRRALDIEPRNPAAHNNLGRLYDEDGRSAAAIDHYTSALDADPANTIALQNLCSAWIRAGEFRRAINGLSELVDRGGAPPEVYSNLALAWLQSGQRDKAKEILGRGLERHPENQALAGARKNLDAGPRIGAYPLSAFQKDHPGLAGARIQISVPALHEADKYVADAVSLYQAGQFEQAVEAFTRAAALTPHRDVIYYNLGLCFLDWARHQGYLDRLLREAVFHFDKANEINPELVEAYINKGVACGLMADQACAEKAYRDALRITDDFDAVYNLTLLYIKQGRCLKARETANAYLGAHEAGESVTLLRSILPAGTQACAQDEESTQ